MELIKELEYIFFKFLWNAGPDRITRKLAIQILSSGGVRMPHIVKRYIRVGYNSDIMRQSACLVLNPITVYSYGFLFNCTTVGQASDSMTALT